ncbi:MAG: TylF/MycF/NovP-related O-methyltransferase [Acidobacteriota bacterium]
MHAILSQANRVTRKLGKRLFSQLLYASFEPEARPQLDLIEAVKKERRLLIRLDEAYYLINAVQSAAKIAGDLAEVGVYQGASAKLICETRSPDRHLHLFDTYAGLPQPGNLDPSFIAGEYSCDLESVQQYLSAYQNVSFYKGLFPGTAGPVADKRFSFVNLDVDLYESTQGALEFFYPRMSPGGILMSHDYGSQTGVRMAFDQFLADKPEPLVRLIGSQCLLVKLA